MCGARCVFFAILADLNRGRIYMDQTGTFLVQSYNNMKLILVAYVYDIIAILAIPLQQEPEEPVQPVRQSRRLQD